MHKSATNVMSWNKLSWYYIMWKKGEDCVPAYCFTRLVLSKIFVAILVVFMPRYYLSYSRDFWETGNFCKHK